MDGARSSMRILLLGKRGSLVLWLENLHGACIRMGYAARTFAINGEDLGSRLRVKWEGRGAATAGWMMARFERALAAFQPDLVLVAGVFGVPLGYYQILHGRSPRPSIAGLVGDHFPAESRERADHCDRLDYTDSSFFAAAKAAGFVTAGRRRPPALPLDRAGKLPDGVAGQRGGALRYRGAAPGQADPWLLARRYGLYAGVLAGGDGHQSRSLRG